MCPWSQNAPVSFSLVCDSSTANYFINKQRRWTSCGVSRRAVRNYVHLETEPKIFSKNVYGRRVHRVGCVIPNIAPHRVQRNQSENFKDPWMEGASEYFFLVDVLVARSSDNRLLVYFIFNFCFVVS